VELVPPLFVLAGIAIVIASIRGLIGANRFARQAQRTSALVTELRWRAYSNRAGSSGPNSRVAHPVLRFDLPDGRTVEVESGAGTNPPSAREGDTVTVLYDPADPTVARLDGLMSSGRLTAVIGLIIGLAFVVFGSLITVVFHVVGDLS
jgi:hypothetical protein